ncbi:maleylpyruvate isomerase family mycothiol-dependent enzyme [Pedococcus sp. KACC 23699]|uniref:Maleylpyruvate isomerase family mycothiol-dependent enzyme n=1 Tax=Pedococcus sp. KACC 23699 TaxID=3149228 RepID=A0AAU7JUN6_9MICO
MTPDTDRSLLAAHTQRLLETAAALDDVSAPSLCEGWTRGHVLTHVARNAEAIGRLASWAVTGERQEMYPGGSESRDAEIEAGAGRDAAEQLADLTATAQGLTPALEALDGPLAAERVEMRGGYEVAAQRLPFLRLREVVYHHVDLDAGFTFDDVEPELLRQFVGDAVDRLALGSRPPAMTLRATEGDTWTVGDGTTTVNGSLGALLLWLARRLDHGVSSESGSLPSLPRGA